MTPLEILELSQTVTDVYEKMEYDLMMNVVKNIRNYDQVTPTGQWQIQKLAEIGKLNKQNIKIMSDMLGGTSSYFEDMITNAAMQTISEIEPGFQEAVKEGILDEAIEPDKSPNIKQAMKGYEKQAKQSLNLVNTTMRNNTKDMFVKLINDTATIAEEIGKNQEAINVLNKTAGQVISGAESRQQALRKTIKEFNAKGITAFVDSAGKNWTPEAYTNMVLRSTVGNVANGTQLARANDYGVDYLETSSHSGARPKCAKDQGKIFCISGKDKRYPKWSSSSYGEPDGILGINCGHSTYPFVPGVNIQRFFPKDEDENDKQYKLIQGQRSIERDVRKSKRELAMFDMLGDKEAFQEASMNLKRKEAKLNMYCKQNGLPRRRNREQVEGFGKSTSVKAIESNKTYLKQLEINKQDDIIKSEIKKIGLTGDIDLHPKISDPNKYSYDDEHINKQRKHYVTHDEAKQFIKDADFTATRWNGKYVNYYGKNGSAYLNTETDEIRTAFKSEEYDDKIKEALEVLKKNGR